MWKLKNIESSTGCSSLPKLNDLFWFCYAYKWLQLLEFFFITSTSILFIVLIISHSILALMKSSWSSMEWNIFNLVFFYFFFIFYTCENMLNWNWGEWMAEMYVVENFKCYTYYWIMDFFFFFPEWNFKWWNIKLAISWL